MEISAEWRQYLIELKDYLSFHQIDLDDFYQTLVAYNDSTPEDPENPCDSDSIDPEDPEGLSDTPVIDIPPALPRIINQHWLDLSEYPLALNAQVIYQIWLYFRQHDSMALRYLSDESESCQVRPELIEAYLPVYNQHFESIFRAFLDRTSHTKRLFFVIIQDYNFQHLILDWSDGAVKVYQVESNIGIDIITKRNINHTLYTIFSSE